MFWVFNFLEQKIFLCYHKHAWSLNDQGQIYLMPGCMTGLDTVTLNNAFEHAQYLEIIFFGETRVPDCTCIFKNRTDD